MNKRVAAGQQGPCELIAGVPNPIVAYDGSDRPPRIAVSLPHFLALPALLADSEFAAIVPRPLARAFERAHAVTTYELPYATTPVEVRLLWHERIEGESAHDWLHDILRRATGDLRRGR
ncbi:hypothetical protein LPJ38_24625 [Bradyrhizobium daqingense]|uniref:hypothetical protein n=1 Tax=Bradyrhizobium daqingense TaxID=993502 RepID=UPI001E62F940|nr:hypothetical protein [Bradyrhizobium daqingense]UFS86836.1 hypothetical protein LPJ38_24625 [Bradyrhizobium daqingense]